MLVFVSQDLAMYINEVKRDNETLKKISEFQSSIENLVRIAYPFISFTEKPQKTGKKMELHFLWLPGRPTINQSNQAN